MVKSFDTAGDWKIIAKDIDEVFSA
jgi:hypothetical protein